MTDKVLLRLWLYPAYPWRAIDKDGTCYYFKVKPKMAAAGWAARSFNFIHSPSETSQTTKTWSEESWKESLQSHNQYVKLKKSKQ